MFRGLINDAKAAAGATVAKYAARASVAVPFIIALGFATAGVTLMLVDRFGHRNAYFMVAGGFVVLGLLAGLIVRTRHEEVIADEHAKKADTADVATDAEAAAAVQMPLALLGALLSSSPSSVLSLTRILGRHLPRVLMLLAISVLFWPKSTEETVAEGEPYATRDPGLLRPNGAYRSGEFRDAA